VRRTDIVARDIIGGEKEKGDEEEKRKRLLNRYGRYGSDSRG
jgi:hypothetical protein